MADPAEETTMPIIFDCVCGAVIEPLDGQAGCASLRSAARPRASRPDEESLDARSGARALEVLDEVFRVIVRGPCA